MASIPGTSAGFSLKCSVDVPGTRCAGNRTDIRFQTEPGLFLSVSVVQSTTFILAKRVTGQRVEDGLHCVPFDNPGQPLIITINKTAIESALKFRQINFYFGNPQ